MAALTVQEEYNRGDTNNEPQLAKLVAMGNVLSALASGALVTETVAMTSNSGVLSQRALVIMGIDARTGTTTGALSLVGNDATLATHQAAIAADRKTFTTYATDAVTAIHVTYLPAPAGLETALASVYR